MTPIELSKKFILGNYENDIDSQTWREAFVYMATQADECDFDKESIHLLWTVNGGHLRRKIENDDLVLAVLRMALPKYFGPSMTLYRGECSFLYEQNRIGFCWSPHIDVATRFASGLNAIESGGVLLQAYAPVDAILAGPNEHSATQMNEFEYTCDPNLLQQIKVLKRFERFAPHRRQ